MELVVIVDIIQLEARLIIKEMLFVELVGVFLEALFHKMVVTLHPQIAVLVGVVVHQTLPAEVGEAGMVQAVL